MKKESLLITGACGFIGSNFLDVIDYQKFKNIVVIDKLSYSGKLENIKEHLKQRKIIFLKKGIESKSILNDLKRYEITSIINFAAESHVDNSIDGPEIFFKTNLMGTLNLINCFKKHYESINLNNTLKKKMRFLHISTDEVFGSLKKKEKSFTEQSSYKPRNPYSASKAASDHLCKSYFNTFKLPILITNCSNNYGPKQHKEKLIPKIIDCILKRKKIPVYGRGQNIRDWIFVKDHCEGIYKVLTRGKVGETYNIGTDNEITNIELVKQICLIMQFKKPSKMNYLSLICFVQDRKGHDFRYSINSKKIKKELKFRPKTKFINGLNKTIDWYLDKKNI